MSSVGAIIVLAALAVGMTLTSSYAVKWAAYARTPLRTGTVQFLLLMMAGMFVGILVYFAVGGTGGVVAGLWVATAVMSASAFLVFVGFLREVRLQGAPRDAAEKLPSRTAFVASVIALVILTEFLMGWSFSLLAGLLPTTLGPGARDTATVFSLAVVSPWFVFPMALEMALTLRWLIAAYPPAMVRFLLLQPAVMVCSPPTLQGAVWVVGTGGVASALMAAAIGFLLLALFRDVRFSAPVATYVTSLILSLGLMAAGLYLWIAYRIPDLYAISLVVQMIIFLRAIVDPTHFTVHEEPLTRPAGRAGNAAPAPPVP